MEEKKILSIERKRIILGPTNVICRSDIRRLCLRPYFHHPNGCPNYGRKPDCPPRAEYFAEIFESTVHVVAIVFNFQKYLDLRRSEHPGWTERALRNPRHWQGHLRSDLKEFINEISSSVNGTVILNPEAMGVDVTQTCKNVGLMLEWPPQKIVCQVALIGKRKCASS